MRGVAVVEVPDRPGTAREQVRVARALAALPASRAEFAAGRLSYAKVRALTRIATPDTEPDWLEMATPMTAGQLERFARAHRQVTGADGGTGPRGGSAGTSRTTSSSFRAILPAEGAAVVLQALRAARNDLEHPHDQHDDVSAETRAGNSHADRPRYHLDPACRPTARRRRGPGRRPRRDLRRLPARKAASADNPDAYQVIVHAGPGRQDRAG